MLNTIGIAAILLGCLLIAALLMAREQKTSSRLLALAIACGLFRQWLLASSAVARSAIYPYLIRSSFPTELLVLALIFLYVKSVTNPDFRMTATVLWHLLLPSLAVVWCLVVPPWTAVESERDFRLLIKLAVALPYLVRARRQVVAFRQRAEQHLSCLHDLRLRWLSLLFLIAYGLLAIDALDSVTGPDLPVAKLVPVAALLALMAMALFSLCYSPVLGGELRREESEAPDRARKAVLPPDELERLKQRLVKAVEDEQLYLNPDLRLSDLADALNVRPYRISEVLSRGLDTTFYGLINDYRIRKAREMLTDPKAAHLNILGIAMESGFKSKSVFNDTFKRLTGKAPSQFRGEARA